MHSCTKCGQPLSQENRRYIVIASVAEVMHLCFQGNLRKAFQYSGFPRRSIPDLAADAIRDYDGQLWTPSGKLFEAPCIDDIFPDPDQRWIGSFIRPANGRDIIGITKVTAPRIILMDLIYRCYFPELAATFGDFVATNDNNPL